jgi:hypothetical protein
MPTWPVRHNGTTPTVRPAPQLGQHTEEVLGDWLSLKAEEIAVLRAEGAMGAGDIAASTSGDQSARSASAAQVT